MHIIDKSNDNSVQDQKSAQHVTFQGDKCEQQLLIFSHFDQTGVPQIFQIDCTIEKNKEQADTKNFLWHN